MYRRQAIFIILAAIALFVINNILQARYVNKYLGGSAFGLTTMAAMAFLLLATRKMETLPLAYGVYGMLGLPSHLWVGDYMYLLHLGIVLIASFALAGSCM